MITNLTFKDLKNDNDFLSGLHNEEFILVIGAGFSYGVQNNSSSDCKTIPLGKKFLEFTNKKFGSETGEYPIAASLWKDESLSDIEIVNEFKALFLANENKFNYENFERIFIPNWFKIYTLNFDNVLDLAMRNIPDNYLFFSYPNDPINSQKSISHLHGKITNEFKFDDIVFSPNDYIESAKKKHTLYTSFHGDVKTFKKHLIIIGTQFTEQAVLSNFFDGLEEENIKIYHFELSNNNTKLLPQFKQQDYKFIQLTKGVIEIFDFFEENRHIIQKIDLEGAKVIDKAFIEDLEIKTFSKNDFYISKLSNDCQWYGCNKEWGIKRSFYNELKQTVISSFDEERVSNVSAVVYGIGGSGKSTQLRILALELYNEKFKTIWIENFNTFNENSINIIENSPYLHFLIIIEDWYRLSSMYKDSIKEVFNKLSSFSHVRLVIGDRTLKSIYSNKLYNGEETKYEILASENKDIIQKIASKIPEWKNICIDLYQNMGLQNTSLFSVLFIITNIFDKALSSEKIRLLDIKGHFIEIVQSDIKKISKIYPGLAKSIVYAANIYELYKIKITKEALLAIATHFNPSANFNLLNINSTESGIDRLISNYISETNVDSKSDWFNQINFVQFNHDILAEDGLSKSILDDWLSFESQMQLKILDILTNLKDDYTTSSYLYHLLKDSNSFFKDNVNLGLNYVRKLYNSNKKNLFFLQSVLQENSFFNFDIKKDFAIQILKRFEKEKIAKEIISNCLRVLSQQEEGKDFAIQILKRFEKEKIAKEIISNCLRILLKEEEGKDFAIQILKRSEKEKITKEITNNCINILLQQEEGKDFAIQILKRFEKEKIAKEIISNCLRILLDQEEGKDFAIQILKRFEKEKIDFRIINNCLRILSQQEEGKDFAIQILKRFEKEKIEFGIICNCLRILSKQGEGKDFVIQILKRFEREKIEFGIINNCLRILLQQGEGKDFAIQILKRFEKEKIKFGIINNCLRILLQQGEGKDFAIQILKRFEKEKIAKEIISNCLRILLKEEEGKGFAIQILKRFEKEKISHQIISNCLTILIKEEAGKDFAIHILNRFEKEKIDFQIISNCLTILLKEEAGKVFALHILKRFEMEKFDSGIINHCLRILSKEEAGKNFAIQIINRAKNEKIAQEIINRCRQMLMED